MRSIPHKTSTHNYITWSNEGLPFGTISMPMTPTPTPRAAISLRTTTISSPLSIAFHALSNNLWAQPPPLLHQKQTSSTSTSSKCLNVNSDRSARDYEGSTESLEGLQLRGNVESGASFQYLTLSSFPSYIFSFTPSLLLQWFTIFFTSRSSFDIIQRPSFLSGYVPPVIIYSKQNKTYKRSTRR